jgi:polyhydroxyalkanoate synthase
VRKRHGLTRSTCSASARAARFRCAIRRLYPDKVKNLITMVTPVDFHTPDNMLSTGPGHGRRPVRRHARQRPGRSDELVLPDAEAVPPELQQKYVGLVDILDDKAAMENFLRMEKWIFDSPDQAGEAFRQFIKRLLPGQQASSRAGSASATSQLT